jgi:hypothetical protein
VILVDNIDTVVLDDSGGAREVEAVVCGVYDGVFRGKQKACEELKEVVGCCCYNTDSYKNLERLICC